MTTLNKEANRERIKIKLLGRHFAWVNRDFLLKFEKTTGEISMAKFIRKQALLEFDFIFEYESDIERFDELLLEFFYDDKGEWLRSKMRAKIRKD